MLYPKRTTCIPYTSTSTSTIVIIAILVMVTLTNMVSAIPRAFDKRRASTFEYDEIELVGSKEDLVEKAIKDGTLPMLPEVPSVLKFKHNLDFAADDNTQGQLKIRKERFWGRLYINGWPAHMQYLRAHFGSEAPNGELNVLFADPIEGCEKLVDNENHRYTNAIVLVKRGTCTFTQKASMVHEAGAAAVVIINNEDKVEHFAGPEGHHIDLSVNGIRKDEGELLEKWFLENPGTSMKGRIIPFMCSLGENGSQTEHCQAVTKEERDWIESEHIQGGSFTTSKGNEFEFIFNDFGIATPSSMSGLSKNIEIVLSETDGCVPYEKSFENKYVAIERGGCSAVTKALNAAQANASAVFLANTDESLVSFGAAPRVEGLKVTIPVVSISQKAFSAFKESMATEGTEIKDFELSKDVRKKVWNDISKLFSNENWPRLKTLREQKYQRLLKTATTDSMKQAIDSAYLQLMNPAGAATTTKTEL